MNKGNDHLTHIFLCEENFKNHTKAAAVLLKKTTFKILNDADLQQNILMIHQHTTWIVQLNYKSIIVTSKFILHWINNIRNITWDVNFSIIYNCQNIEIVQTIFICHVESFKILFDIDTVKENGYCNSINLLKNKGPIAGQKKKTVKFSLITL